MNERWLGLVAAAITSITWGLQAIVLKLAIQSVPLFTVVWFRFAFALVFLFLFLMWQNPESLKILKRPPLGSILAGFFLAVNYYTFLIGLEHTSPSTAQVMIQAAPYGLAVFSIFYFQEKISWVSALGFLITPVGLYLFFYDQLGVTLAADDFKTGNLWVLLSAAAWIVYSIFQKTLSRVFLPNQILLVVFTVTTLMILPVSQVTTISYWDFSQWSIMILLGFFTLLAYCTLGYALAKAPASQVSIIITCNPLLTIFLMQIFASNLPKTIAPESIRPLGYVGTVLVVGGISLALRQRR